MMNKIFGLALYALLFAHSFPAAAQQPQRVPRIGFLEPSGSATASPRLQSFRQGLHELGYVEGKTIAIEYRSAEGKPDQLAELAAELVRLKVDIIFALGSPAIAAAKNATQTIPVVMSGGDPIRSGLVASLARPGGNITGLSNFSPDLAGKRLELLKEAVPSITRVAVIWNQADQTMGVEFGETLLGAEGLGVQLQSLAVREQSDLERAYEAAANGGADAIVVIADQFITGNRPQLVALSAQSRLPTISGDRDFPRAGGLMAYGPNMRELYSHAAYYVDKILKGAKPGDLPVERPMTFDFVVNLKTARELGITIPPEIMLQVTEVIQ